MRFPKEITIRDKYGPAMEINDPDEASAYFEDCVEHNMSFGNSREEAERVERINLGYYAGYYDHETRLRVERLFSCEHPVFGAAAVMGQPSPESALRSGMMAASGKPKRT